MKIIEQLGLLNPTGVILALNRKKVKQKNCTKAKK
jgi:hypothetical protein